MAAKLPKPIPEILVAQDAFDMAHAVGVNVPTTIPAMGNAVCSWICAKMSSFWGWCFCTPPIATYVVGLAVFIVVGTVILQIASRLA